MTQTMPADFARCHGKITVIKFCRVKYIDCPQRNECLRYKTPITTNPVHTFVSISGETQVGNCQEFIKES